VSLLVGAEEKEEVGGIDGANIYGTNAAR